MRTLFMDTNVFVPRNANANQIDSHSKLLLLPDAIPETTDYQKQHQPRRGHRNRVACVVCRGAEPEFNNMASRRNFECAQYIIRAQYRSFRSIDVSNPSIRVVDFRKYGHTCSGIIGFV